MKVALRHIMTMWLEHPETAQSVQHMLRLKDDKGWKAFQGFMLMLKANIRETPLSADFLKLSEQQKLMMLQSFHWMDQFLDFMLNPLSVVEQHQKIKEHNKKMAEKADPNRKAKT